MKPKILIAVLNWGLGHATRCIPIIQALQNAGYSCVIASDGGALAFLQEEFPSLAFEELPAYQITYSSFPNLMMLKMAWQMPKIYRAAKQEKKIIDKIIDKHHIKLLISDNRLGAYSDKIPSVYITHQLQILSGITTYFTSKAHAHFYHKFNQIWVPDLESEPNFSGKLGHLKSPNEKVKYIGLLSRMGGENLPVQYDILAILSGPEPQRSIFEKILLDKLSHLDKKILLVQGKVFPKVKRYKLGNIEVISHAGTKELEAFINQSDTIISRSGYTSVMDMAILQKKVLWVPTPGQTEQKYIARHLQKHFGAKYVEQKHFRLIKPSVLASHTKLDYKQRILELVGELLG